MTAATFVNVPLSISAWVIVYVPVKVVASEAPGARDGIGSPKISIRGSVTYTFVRVVFPSFVMVKL